MKQQEPMKTVKALVGNNVIESKRCCGESGTLGVTRPDIATQVRFRKEAELQKDEQALRTLTGQATGDMKILTSCPSCLQGLSRYQDDLKSGLLEADYIVVEMAKQILGEDWLPEYVARGLDMIVVAEGVETEAQWDHLLKAGCRQFQGHLLGRPQPAAAIDRKLPALRSASAA
jgi:hypothetical protein